ncbi:MAG: sigma-70 family RNA polymerase sigma factor [Mycobacteriales bacterium]
MRALVSATEVTQTCRAQADRVHDVVRRLGCDPAEASEVTESALFELIDALVRRPESVRDLVGGLFARARRLAEQVRSHRTLAGEGPADAADASTSVLRAAGQDAAVEAGLDTLGDRQRFALLLRDSYNLSPAQVAVALGADPGPNPEATLRAVSAVIGEARLALLSAVGEQVPSVPAEHATSLAELTALSDGTAAGGGRTPVARRHVSGCAPCAAVLDAQTRARALMVSLAVLALPDDERDPILRRAAARAEAALPSAAAVAQELTADDDGPLLPPVLVGLALAVALVLGALTGALLSQKHTAAAGGLPPLPTTASPGASPSPKRSPSASPTPTPTGPASPAASPSPSPSATASRPTPSPTPSRSTQPPAGPATIVLNPSSGPNGTTLTVTGSGWDPGLTVTLRYLDPVGQPAGPVATAVAGPNGTFTQRIVAEDRSNLPGPHQVSASNGKQSASAVFQAST